ncbi:MAG: DUF5011 domain-containing protein [Clostridiales bacterium]|jgi:hypothetical protein|nr:DUF5011 domain-containing protein [Clostridiales bacterium]
MVTPYSEIINPISLEDRYKCAVTISPDELTNQDVYVTLDLSFNNEAWLDIDKDKLLADGTIAGFDKIKEDAGGKLTSIEIRMSQNGDIPFKITPFDTAYPAANRMIPITNINKSLPSVTVAFTYAAAVIDGKTKGNITASLASDRAIIGYNGSSLIHVFTLENQTEERYFEYLDLFGNLSYVVATCPAQIVEQDIYDLDTDPPDYDLKIIRLENLVPKTMVNYTKAEYEARLAADTLEFPYFNNQLRLEFTVYDLNKTEMTLAAPGGGAALLGNTVTVYANSEFTVYITDAKGNVTTVPVKITGYDYDPPEGIVELIDMGDFSRGYLAITNKAGQKISVTNKTGVGYDSLKGQYYHDFYKNETFIFLLLDEAGNTGAVSGRVGSMDGDPAGVSISWMPYYVDEFGNINPDRLNPDPSNGNVTAYLRFSKAVKDIDFDLISGNPADVFLTCTDLAATVTFAANASIRLRFTAVNNGIAASRQISVDIIDKSQPQVTAAFLSVENKKAIFRFDSDKEVYLLENEGIRDSGLKKWEKQHTIAYDLNGIYKAGFVDKAGNTIFVSVIVDQLDIMPPIFKIEGLPLTKSEVAKALVSTDPDMITMIAAYEAGGHKFEHLITKNDITLKVSINKAGTIRFGGHNYNVAQDAFIDLTVSQNGNYEIIATDLAGNQNAYLFTVDVIDKTAPSISFSGNLWVKQGSSRDEFLAAAKANVTVTDNLDPDMSGKWSVSELSGTELDTMGTYYITYTATDTAGNTATAKRIVTVFDKDILEVKINGISTVPGDTLILSSKNITVTVANVLSGPGGNEPYKIKYQAGLNTNAQMKNAQDITAGGSFTAAKSGFYTIYVVTQSKKEYLTYIYVEF